MPEKAMFTKKQVIKAVRKVFDLYDDYGVAVQGSRVSAFCRKLEDLLSKQDPLEFKDIK